MADPSKILPRLPKGDATQDEVLLGVGYALTLWEQFQSDLTGLFCAIVKCDEWPLRRAFEVHDVALTRLKMVEEAAKTRYCSAFMPQDPKTNKRVVALINLAQSLNHRRNDIAHGLVANIHSNDRSLGWYLVPGGHNRKFDRETLTMSYVWTSSQVRQYADEFSSLAAATMVLMNEILASNVR